MNPKKGSMPVLQWMRPDMLAVDPAYQRSIDNSVSRVMKNIVDAFLRPGPLPGSEFIAEDKHWQ